MRDFVINDKSENVLHHYRKGDWRKILALFNNIDDGFYDERFLWIRPSEKDLQFIAGVVGSNQLISLGCGSGLLEWLIREATGVRVAGVEVDRNWWESPYAPPTFLPLHYSDEMSAVTASNGTDVATPTDSTLMFCYFNNAPAFHEYVKNYGGDCVIIIGPGKGRGDIHTDPEPFNAKFTPEWSMSAFHEIGTTKDVIAVYKRLSLLASRRRRCYSLE